MILPTIGFLRFYTKLQSDEWRKVTKPDFREKKCVPRLGVKRGQNEVFVHFLEFASFLFANFAYYDRWA